MSLSKDSLFRGEWIFAKEYDYGEGDANYYQNDHNTILKKEFTVDNFEKASIYVASLGYYIVTLNGHRVGEDELNSDWTNYQKIVYYDEYDISNYLNDGINYLEIELGNGMYNPSPLKLFGKYNLREKLAEVGTPKVICDIAVDDKIILSSDKSWNWVNGNLLFNNLYLGETADLTYHDEELKPVLTVADRRNYLPSFIPKTKQCNRVSEYTFMENDEGIQIDFHEMISGYINIKFKAKKGDEVVITYSEYQVDGKLEFESSYAGSVGMVIENHHVTGGPGAPEKAIQTDRIICQEGVNEFINKFTYHSFRYALIKGITKEDLVDVEAIYVHTDLEFTGRVDCDNEFYNELYDAAIRTKLNNIHGVFEDCARERLAYGGDIVALAQSNLFVFDVKTMYQKTIVDFRIEQTENGGVPETAPFMGIGSNGTAYGEGPLLWQFVYPFLVVKNYQYYGDLEAVKTEYPYVKKLVDYLLTFDLATLANHCLGDHGSILTAGNFKTSTPDKVFTGYCTILLFVEYLLKIQGYLACQEDKYLDKYNEIKAEITANFQNDDMSFGDKTHTGYAFAIESGLGDTKLLVKQLANRIAADDYVLNSGIFGMSFIYDALNKYHYDDIIDAWLNKEEQPSFKFMLAKGSKILEEQFFNKYSSYNHAMFSSYVQWYYQGLAGIRVEDDAIGSNKLSFSPYFSKNMNKFNCSYQSNQGAIEVSWYRANDKVTYELELPEGLKDYQISFADNYEVLSESQNENHYTFEIKEN